MRCLARCCSACKCGRLASVPTRHASLRIQLATDARFTQLCAAQAAIGIYQFDDQTDLQRLIVRFGYIQLGIADFQLALDAAKQIQLTVHVQAQIVTFAA